MLNTPSSRTSKNGTARKRANRKTQKYSLAQPPVIESAAMHPPPPPVDSDVPIGDDEKSELLRSPPQLDMLLLEDEDERRDSIREEAPERVLDYGTRDTDESGAPAEWHGPVDNTVDLDFDPFSNDSDIHEQQISSPYEFREQVMPQQGLEEPAPVRVADDYDVNGESAESATGAQPDTIKTPPRSVEAEQVRGRSPDVTRLDSPPISPPLGSGRTRAPILVSRCARSFHTNPLAIMFKCLF